MTTGFEHRPVASVGNCSDVGVFEKESVRHYFCEQKSPANDEHREDKGRYLPVEI